MTYGDRKSPRIAFTNAIDATVISIDGTCQHPCVVFDISESGAKIALVAENGVFELQEFFLLMSTRGVVHRRCRTVRRFGKEIGVAFVRDESKRSLRTY